MDIKMSDAPSSKRAKYLSTDSPPHICNLPDSVLLNTVSYLQETSRVLLAVALTASSASWREELFKIKPSDSAVLILKEGKVNKFHSYVDFVNTEKTLAAKLSDEDIGGVLKCVGALHTIKHLKLTHCVGMKGSCLEPLRASTTLMSIDLSLVEDKASPNINPEPAISTAEVIPILHSIIDAEGCSLNHIQFPKKWRGELKLFFTPKKQLLMRFLSKYNRIMKNSNVTCGAYKCTDGNWGRCGRVCQGTEEHPWVNTGGNNFGIFNSTCYSCNDTYCQECKEDDQVEDLAVCEKCEKNHCSDCNETLKCDTCQETTCHECSFIGTCDTCEKSSCDKCCQVFSCECGQTRCTDCVSYNFCDYRGCLNHNCAECAHEDPLCAKFCRICETMCCDGHVMINHINYGEEKYCPSCNEIAATQLSSRNDNFETWVNELEEKYGREFVQQPSAEETFAEAMQRRESLRQRCHAVGRKLLFKQKMFEKFEQKLQRYESDLMNGSGRR